MSDVRRCARCRRMLPASAFGPDPRMRSQLKSWCRECHAARNRDWRAENAEYVAEANAARRKGRPSALVCDECGEPFEATRRDALLCSRRCKARRERRLHPEKVRDRERQKAARKRERLALVEGGEPPRRVRGLQSLARQISTLALSTESRREGST